MMEKANYCDGRKTMILIGQYNPAQRSLNIKINVEILEQLKGKIIEVLDISPVEMVRGQDEIRIVYREVP